MTVLVVHVTSRENQTERIVSRRLFEYVKKCEQVKQVRGIPLHLTNGALVYFIRHANGE